MKNADETTAKELGQALASEGYAVSKSTILRCRRRLLSRQCVLPAHKRDEQGGVVMVGYAVSRRSNG